MAPNKEFKKANIMDNFHYKIEPW